MMAVIVIVIVIVIVMSKQTFSFILSRRMFAKYFVVFVDIYHLMFTNRLLEAI